MDPLAVLLRVVLLPAGVSIAAALLSRVVSRVVARTGDDGDEAGLRDAIVAVGAAAAFCAALFALGVRPSLPLAPSEDAWGWVFWYAIVGAALGVAGLFGPRSRSLRFVLHAAAGAVLAWAMVRMFPTVAPTTVALRAAGAGLVSASLATALTPRDDRGPVALAIVVAALAAAGAMWRNGGFVLLTLATAAFATSIGAAAAFRRARGGLAIPAALTPFVGLVFTGLLLGAYQHGNFGAVVGFPLAAALLLAASALAAAISRARLAVAAAVALGLAAAIVAASLGTTANRWVE